jgi:peptidyl-prolyl cis-trans isomerase D
LQEVRQAVEKSYRQAQSGQLAREAAEALLTNLKQGENLQQLVKGELFKVEETGFFPHSYGAFIPKIGNSAELADKAFELTVENPVADGVYPLGDQFIVARLEERQPADMSKLTEATRQDLSEVLLTREKRALLEGRLAALREKADIRIDPSLDFSLEGE